MTNPFPTPGESNAAHRIAVQAVEDAGLQPHESSGAKTTAVADAMASILAKAKEHRNVNTGVPAAARTGGPWYRRFNTR